MARTVRDAKLDSREARNRLPVRLKPHWRALRPGKLHLGYCRRRRGQPGYWTVRTYIGMEAVGEGESPYRIEKLPGLADDFEDANGESILSFAQAQDKALARHSAVQGTRGPITVAEVLDDYIQFLHREKRTGRDAERRANKLILPELGSIKVAELTTARLVRWRDALAEKPARLRTANDAPQKSKKAPTTDDARRARRATVNRTLTILKAALNRGFKLGGVIDDDLAWRRVKPFEKVHAARPDHLTVAEAKRLINAADRESGFHDLVHAALLTGCRYGELCALLVRDFAHGMIAIRTSKSGDPRDVRLTKEGVAFFEQLTVGRERNALMFERAGGGAWKKSMQARPMRDACKRAKIVPPVGFHQLRHTWASLAVMNGVPLLVVARNLGHKDTRMVERHYGHMTTSYIDEAIKAGAPRFGAVKPSNVTPMRGRA